MTVGTQTLNEVSQQIDWAVVEGQINAKECKLNKLALDIGIPANILRLALVEHYGDRIEFKRGRRGGIFWRTS